MKKVRNDLYSITKLISSELFQIYLNREYQWNSWFQEVLEIWLQLVKSAVCKCPTERQFCASSDAAIAGVLQKMVFLKVRKFHSKASVSDSLFHKVAGFQACYFIKKRLQHRYFPVKFPKFLRMPSFTEHIRWLLLLTIHFITYFK